MIIYLAGGISGNCKPMWTDLLSGKKTEGWVISDNMNLYLAGLNSGMGPIYIEESKLEGICILESFYYADEWIEKAIPLLKSFILDSGAFTFLASRKGEINWDEYTDKYIDFINRNKIDLFLELDIDSLVGYDEVLRLRDKIEKGTGKKPIPVWHKSRGKEEFLKMCDEYPYVAIGGIVTKEITGDEHKYFPWFINEAHKRGTKIHGLGFTNLEGIKKYHFDSVDSTSWTTGNRFGAIYRFDGKTMAKYGKQEGQRLKNPRETAVNNFNEWVKFQKYAENNL